MMNEWMAGCLLIRLENTIDRRMDVQKFRRIHGWIDDGRMDKKVDFFFCYCMRCSVFSGIEKTKLGAAETSEMLKKK